MPRTAGLDGAHRDEPARPRSRKGVETKSRLVDAAKCVFEEQGFLDARVADITARAGLSHGSFYHYFDSKQQIFREVADAQERLLTEPAVADSGDRAPLGLAQRIRRANRRYLTQYRDEARIMGVIEEVSRYDEHVRGARAETQRHFADRAEQHIRSWQQEGIVDTGIDPSIAAMALGAMVARFAELWLVQGYAEYDFEAAVDQLTRLWCNALGLAAEQPAE